MNYPLNVLRYHVSGAIARGEGEAIVEVRPLKVIAQDIRNVWGNKVYFGAVPYLDAMSSLNSINDMYGADSAKSIVIYFLGNANSFRGDAAKALKAELKKIAGIK
jgi:hypothetical protein